MSWEVVSPFDLEKIRLEELSGFNAHYKYYVHLYF